MDRATAAIHVACSRLPLQTPSRDLHADGHQGGLRKATSTARSELYVFGRARTALRQTGHARRVQGLNACIGCSMLQTPCTIPTNVLKGSQLSSSSSSILRNAFYGLHSPLSPQHFFAVADKTCRPSPQRQPVGGTVCLAGGEHVEYRGGISGEGARFGVVVGLFNEVITKPLLAGALEAFKRHGVKDDGVEIAYVPGSFEIPIVAQGMAKSGKFDAILCIGAVIRGSTTHYDAVAGAAASGVLNVGLSTGVPCIFGILTCETMDQAIDRAGGKLGNKGAEVAVTAVEMASLMKTLRSSGSVA